MAQWNPAAADYTRTDPHDIRVMTWNVQDALCSTNPRKQQATSGDWSGLARVVAAMDPDVLLLQETGDNSGNGTGGGVDSVASLTTVMNLFVQGGNDPFQGNAAVQSYVELFNPSTQLRHVFVSSANDGFNRQVILSKYPFADINNDGAATLSNFTVLADAYVPTSGNGGSAGRGVQWAEIDLPDNVYAGDLVVSCAHLKSGSDQSDKDDREVVAQRMAYFIDYFYNGAGTGTVDPNNKIPQGGVSTTVLDANTPIILGGDWNEDENTNGRKGPAEWITRAAVTGPTDGTDRDRSDMMFDDSRDFFDNSRNTQGSSKLDYIAWQDSIATLRRSWVFDSRSMGSAVPAEFAGFTPNVIGLSGIASDHLPVIADFVLQLGMQDPPQEFSLVSPADGAALNGTIPLDWENSLNADEYVVRVSTTPDIVSGLLVSQTVSSSSFAVADGTLTPCGTYYWNVIAQNGVGMVTSNETWSFVIPAPGDWDGSGGAPNSSDFLAYLNDFAAMDPRADLSPIGGDGLFNSTDFLAFLNIYAQGCN
jgi:endonuclease/exonuclease/phosphatase family metal-dependent hydrolase